MRPTRAADYLVVGAGAAGMAFTDALADYSDARILVVDRRPAPGGHWLDAYPFVRLHQASVFYGVASTELGTGNVQIDGPERGMHERVTAPEIVAYYSAVLGRLVATGRVELSAGTEWLGAGRLRSLDSGQEEDVHVRRAVVDAHYLEPAVPATSPPPFDVADGARVVPVGELPSMVDGPSQYVVVGSGKTATDAIVWLLSGGVDPDAISWVRPRDPWMLNRAVVQPDPAVFLGMVATIMEAAAAAPSLEAFFLALEDAGVMLRLDRDVPPTMARTPTLAQWELDLLRSIEDVIRLGHVQRAEPGALVMDGGRVPLAPDAVVVNCAASAFPDKPHVPVWDDGTITLQPIRSGFPCFGAALIGYVEATRGDAAEKNRVCPSSPYPNSLAEWATMTVLGARAAAAFGREPDIRAWAGGCVLNPARVPADRADDDAVLAAQAQIAAFGPPGLARLAELAGIA